MDYHNLQATAMSELIEANSVSVVLAIKNEPKNSTGLTPVEVRTRIIASKTTGRLKLFLRSAKNRSPSKSGWKYVYLYI